MSAGFLIDTNVLSEFNQEQPPNPHVKQWLSATQFSLLYVSVVTLSEIRFGSELLAEGRRRKDLHSWFDGGRILGIDEEIGNLWARLSAQRQRKGRPLDILDGLIAATAVKHKLTMATRDVKDFADLGLSILNPWDGA